MSSHDLRAGKNKASKGLGEKCATYKVKHIQRPRGETVHQRFREKSQGWLGAEEG